MKKKNKKYWEDTANFYFRLFIFAGIILCLFVILIINLNKDFNACSNMLQIEKNKNVTVYIDGLEFEEIMEDTNIREFCKDKGFNYGYYSEFYDGILCSSRTNFSDGTIRSDTRTYKLGNLISWYKEKKNDD